MVGAAISVADARVWARVNKPDHRVLKDLEWLEGAMRGRKQAYILVGLFIGVLVFLPTSGPVIAQS